MIFLGEVFDEATCRVRAAVVHRDDLAEVLVEVFSQSVDERYDVLLFVVAGDNNRDRPMKRLMLDERDPGTLWRSWRFLRVDQDRAGEGTHVRRVFQKDRQVAKKPGQGASQRPVDEVVVDRKDTREADLGDELVQLWSAEQDARVAAAKKPCRCPARLEKDVPGVALVKEKLAAGLEELVDTLQEPGAVPLVEEVHGDDEVEATAGQLAGKVR